MGFSNDPGLSGAGYLPQSREFRASVSGDDLNLNLEIQPANHVRTLSITIPSNVQVQSAQLDLKIIGGTTNIPVTYQVTLNGVQLLIGVCNSDPTLIPITLFSGSIGTIFGVSNNDVLKLIVSGNPGGLVVTCAGGLSVYGVFV